MNISKKLRRAALLSLLVGSTVLSSGCSTTNGFSLASVNPFSKSAPVSAKAPNLNAKKSQNSFASRTKSALANTRDAVTGMFSGKDKADPTKQVKSDVDPLRLDDKAEVGPEVYIANGRLWESTGNNAKAMESYARALKSEENNPDALAAIARLHYKQENFNKASEFFQQAVKQKSNDASLYNDLGLTLNKLGNANAATMALSRALEIAPGTSRYANNLASVHFETGKAEKAFQVLSKNNETAVAHYNMAYLYQKSGNVSEAKKHLNAAVDFEKQGSTNASIARAVNRSKELLASMDASKVPNAAAGLDRAIAQSLPTSTSTPKFEIRQTSQAEVGREINVKPATMRTPVERKQVAAQFATARLGKKTTEVQAPSTGKSSAPSTTPQMGSGPFVLPPGFGVPSK